MNTRKIVAWALALAMVLGSFVSVFADTSQGKAATVTLVKSTGSVSIQNASGKEKAAWAKFGVSTARSALTLHPGHYAVKYKLCNWNQPEFKPVTVAIETPDGEEVASEVFTPTVNIGNDTGNKFSKVNLQVFEFDITEKGDYVIVFYTDAARNADFVLGQVSIQAMSFVATGIAQIPTHNAQHPTPIYDLSGRRVKDGQLNRGIYIIDGKKVVVR